MKQSKFYFPNGDNSGSDAGSDKKTDSTQLKANDTVYVSPDGGTTNEAFPKQGVEYDFCVDVTNTGNLPSGAFFVQFTLGGDENPPFEQDFAQDAGLDAGASVKAVVHFGSFPNEFKDYLLEACIYSPSAPDKPINCADTFDFPVNTESTGTSSTNSSGASGNSDSADSSSSNSGNSGGDKATSNDGSNQTHADASSVTATPVNIHYDVFLVAQPDDCTCWAASSAMVLSYWHDVETSSSNPSYTVQEIKDRVTNAGPQYDISCGLKPEDTRQVGDILGLTFDFPMCYGVDGFAATLKDKGPIVFVRASVGGKGAHAIAVIGMSGDGTPDGTTVETLNPSPVGVGAQQNVPFTQLMTMMEQLGFWDQNDWSKSGGLDRVYVMYKK